MRIKTLLGLVAVGGAVHYANKKRGGDMTLASFKETLTDLGTQVRDKLSAFTGSMSNPRQMADADMADSGDGFDNQYSSGFGGDTARTARH